MSKKVRVVPSSKPASLAKKQDAAAKRASKAKKCLKKENKIKAGGLVSNAGQKKRSTSGYRGGVVRTMVFMERKKPTRLDKANSEVWLAEDQALAYLHLASDRPTPELQAKALEAADLLESTKEERARIKDSGRDVPRVGDSSKFGFNRDKSALTTVTGAKSNQVTYDKDAWAFRKATNIPVVKGAKIKAIPSGYLIEGRGVGGSPISAILEFTNEAFYHRGSKALYFLSIEGFLMKALMPESGLSAIASGHLVEVR